MAFDGKDNKIEGIRFVDYVDESQLEDVMSLVGRDLSEPYSIFTYRFFLYRYPELCILAVNDANEPIGCVVGKIDDEEVVYPVDPMNATAVGDQEDRPEITTSVGYIGMLAVTKEYRRRGIGKALVEQILRRMRSKGCTSATLETEVTNATAGNCFRLMQQRLEQAPPAQQQQQQQQQQDNHDRQQQQQQQQHQGDNESTATAPDFGLMALQNRPPWWNVELGSFVLNFGGRVSVASVKNFQLCEPTDHDTIILQFGRINGRHSFTMDFQHPLSAVQAFSIAISSLQSKISFG